MHILIGIFAILLGILVLFDFFPKIMNFIFRVLEFGIGFIVYGFIIWAVYAIGVSIFHAGKKTGDSLPNEEGKRLREQRARKESELEKLKNQIHR